MSNPKATQLRGIQKRVMEAELQEAEEQMRQAYLSRVASAVDATARLMTDGAKDKLSVLCVAFTAAAVETGGTLEQVQVVVAREHAKWKAIMDARTADPAPSIIKPPH